MCYHSHVRAHTLIIILTSPSTKFVTYARTTMPEPGSKIINHKRLGNAHSLAVGRTSRSASQLCRSRKMHLRSFQLHKPTMEVPQPAISPAHLPSESSGHPPSRLPSHDARVLRLLLEIMRYLLRCRSRYPKHAPHDARVLPRNLEMLIQRRRNQSILGQLLRQMHRLLAGSRRERRAHVGINPQTPTRNQC